MGEDINGMIPTSNRITYVKVSWSCRDCGSTGSFESPRECSVGDFIARMRHDHYMTSKVCSERHGERSRVVMVACEVVGDRE